MFKCLLLPITLLLSFLSSAQKKDNLIGKWKVVSANNGVFYDYKKETQVVTKEFLNTLIGQKDSAETVNTYISFARQYSDYYFVFASAGKFEEIDNGEIRLEGTYIIKTNEKKIEIKIGSSDNGKNLEAKYIFMNDGLHIFVQSLFLKYETDLRVEKIIN